jgi:hypothetical protein
MNFRKVKSIDWKPIQLLLKEFFYVIHKTVVTLKSFEDNIQLLTCGQKTKFSNYKYPKFWKFVYLILKLYLFSSVKNTDSVILNQSHTLSIKCFMQTLDYFNA